MKRIHFTCRTVPELTPLSPIKREEVLIVTGREFRKSRGFWPVWIAGQIATFGVSAGTWIILRGHVEQTAAILAAGIMGLIGYTLWFQVRLSAQLPYIRRHLETEAGAQPYAQTKEAPTVAHWISRHPWRFTIAGGVLFGSLFTIQFCSLEDSHVPCLILWPVATVGGFVCAGVSWWVRKKTM